MRAAGKEAAPPLRSAEGRGPGSGLARNGRECVTDLAFGCLGDYRLIRLQSLIVSGSASGMPPRRRSGALWLRHVAEPCRTVRWGHASLPDLLLRMPAGSRRSAHPRRLADWPDASLDAIPTTCGVCIRTGPRSTALPADGQKCDRCASFEPPVLHRRMSGVCSTFVLCACRWAETPLNAQGRVRPGAAALDFGTETPYITGGSESLRLDMDDRQKQAADRHGRP